MYLSSKRNAWHKRPMALIITQRDAIPPAARPVDWHPTVTGLQDSS